MAGSTWSPEPIRLTFDEKISGTSNSFQSLLTIDPGTQQSWSRWRIHRKFEWPRFKSKDIPVNDEEAQSVSDGDPEEALQCGDGQAAVWGRGPVWHDLPQWPGQEHGETAAATGDQWNGSGEMLNCTFHLARGESERGFRGCSKVQPGFEASKRSSNAYLWPYITLRHCSKVLRLKTTYILHILLICKINDIFK